MLWVRLTIEYHELAKKRNMGARKLDELMTRSFIQILIEDLNIMIHFKPYAYHYKSRPYSVMDPTVAKNLNPVTGRLFSWR